MTPRTLIALAAAGAVLAAVLGLYWKGRFDAAVRSAAKIEAARTEAAVRRLEVDGERDLTRRVEVVVRQRETAAAAVSDLSTQALKASDAETPLDPDRTQRLRDLDRRLCAQSPELVGCAPTRNASSGDGAM